MPSLPARPISVARIPSGIEGVRATLALMRCVVRAARKDTVIRYFAADLCRDLAQHDYMAEARAIHEYVRDRVRYIRDIHSVETIQTPRATLEESAGDCDDKTTLFCALAESVGFATAFKAVGINGNRIAHVYPVVIYRGRGVAAEVIRPVPLGWEPDGITSFVLCEV